MAFNWGAIIPPKLPSGGGPKHKLQRPELFYRVVYQYPVSLWVVIHCGIGKRDGVRSFVWTG